MATTRDVVQQAMHVWRERHTAHDGANGRLLPNGGDAASDARTAALVAALDEGRLQLHYQPVVDLVDSHLVAVEALIRPDAELATLMPNAPAIIEVAEASGLIVPLGTFVLCSALRQVAEWRNGDAPHLQMHVNVSPIELDDPEYLSRVENALQATGVAPGALVLELTESAALDQSGKAQRRLVALASLGVVIALDDFGTGFASLDLLATTPARIIKLDRSFTMALGDADDAIVRGRAVITQAAVGMARSLGLDLVAEGIESPGQARTLLGWGCQYGQGFLYSRPVPAEQIDLRSAGTDDESLSRVARPAISTPAIELGMSFARVLAATDVDGGRQRIAAISLAAVMAAALGTERRRAEAAGLLAAIADLASRLEALVVSAVAPRDKSDAATAANPSVSELLDALSVPPVIRRETTAGAIGRTAWALAGQWAAGATAPDPRLLAAHPEPQVHAELVERVQLWWSDQIADRTPSYVLDNLERQLTARAEFDTRLRSFVGLARAIGSSGSFDEMLQVAAEEARQVFGATLLIITEWDDHDRVTRPVVAAGTHLSLHELPEETAQATFPVSTQQVANREIHFEVRGSIDGDPGEQQLLRDLGLGSSACVPIVVDARVWGVLYVATAVDAPPLTMADGPVLSAVATFLAAAISRAQDLERLERYALQDPLTGLANRYRLNDHFMVFQTLRRPDQPAAFAVIDVASLKRLNYEHGHDHGDQLLRHIAQLLDDAAMQAPQAMAARLGGDEFGFLAALRREDLAELLKATIVTAATCDTPARLCAGITYLAHDDEDLTAVVARASDAQFQAKRRGESIGFGLFD